MIIIGGLFRHYFTAMDFPLNSLPDVLQIKLIKKKVGSLFPFPKNVSNPYYIQISEFHMHVLKTLSRSNFSFPLLMPKVISKFVLISCKKLSAHS